jgi:serine/threonine protein kinase
MLGDYGETLLVDWGLAKEFRSEPSSIGSMNQAEDEADEGLEQNRAADASRALLSASGLSTGGESDAGQTAIGVVKGSPGFMSPEQADGRVQDVGPWSDIFSLGATLYAILTGVAPFQGRDLADVLRQVRTGNFPRPRQVVSQAPKPLEAICVKAMHLEPAGRYRDAVELSQDVERWLADEPVLAWREPWHMRLGRWIRRNRSLAISLLASVLLISSVVGISIGLLRSERRDRAAAALQEDAADFSSAMAQIRAERYSDANRIIAAAAERMAREPAVQSRTAAWQRLKSIIEFYQQIDRAWNAWGEENYLGVLAASDLAMRAVKLGDAENWWDHLPNADLDAGEQSRMEQELYRLMMISGAVRTILGTLQMETATGQAASSAQTAIATEIHQALEWFQRAQAWEIKQDRATSLSSHIMSSLNRDLLARLGSAESGPTLTQSQPTKSDADDYFLGLMYFFIDRSTTASANDRLSESRDGVNGNERNEAKPDYPNSSASPASSMLKTALQKRLAEFKLIGQGSLMEMSEQLLRVSAGRERRFWPNFALGRTLYFRGALEQAELAFTTCIVLRPDYARGYEQRALIRGLLSRQTDDPSRCSQLRNLARLDSDQALELALRDQDHSTWWPRGDLLELLDDPAESLKAYVIALDKESEIQQLLNRRQNVLRAEEVARNALAQAESESKKKSDAAAVLALAALARGDRKAVEHFCDILSSMNPNHPALQKLERALVQKK